MAFLGVLCALVVYAILTPMYQKVGQRQLIISFVLGMAIFLATSRVRGEIYQWVDNEGQVHFTDNWGQVPESFRERVILQKGWELNPLFKETSETMQVAKVIDGDTIVLANGKKVRYNGIDAPEIHHPARMPEECGQEALKANNELVEGKEIRLEFDRTKKDRYGRLLAYVFAGDNFVNAELIKQGYARVTASRTNLKYHELFLGLQREARDNDRGLWGGCGGKGSK